MHETEILSYSVLTLVNMCEVSREAGVEAFVRPYN